MKIHIRFERIFSVLAFYFLFISPSKAELFRLQANAPIYGFKFPMFNKHGTKSWQCFGEQVRYISENKVKIEQMHLEWYDPKTPDRIDMTIRSAKATVSLLEHRAQGKTLLTVTNPGYTIMGENWIWLGKKRGQDCTKIIIKKNAHVNFYDTP